MFGRPFLLCGWYQPVNKYNSAVSPAYNNARLPTSRANATVTLHCYSPVIFMFLPTTEWLS